MKILFFSSFFFLVSIGFTQTETPLTIDLVGGPDFNQLNANNDSVIIKKSAVTPFIGFQLHLPINQKNIFKAGAIYSIKGSQTNNRIDYRNAYASLFIHYNYSISPDFSINIGPQYSVLLKSKTVNGAVDTKTKGYSDFLSGEIGFDYRLQKHVRLGLHYEYPYDTKDLKIWPNLKLKLTISIDQNTFNKNKKKQKKAKSNENIKTLKNNALLIRLRAYKRQIELANKTNNINLKNEIIKRRDANNREIMKAFQKRFNFCPVYFFYNSDTKKILKRNFNSVFLDSNLQKDTSIHFSLNKFFIGEISEASTDTSYSTDFSNYGIHIRDENLNIIPKPFPNFISGYFAFSKKDYQDMVRLLNKKLTLYFLRSKRKQSKL